MSLISPDPGASSSEKPFTHAAICSRPGKSAIPSYVRPPASSSNHTQLHRRRVVSSSKITAFLRSCRISEPITPIILILDIERQRWRVIKAPGTTFKAQDLRVVLPNTHRAKFSVTSIPVSIVLCASHEAPQNLFVNLVAIRSP